MPWVMNITLPINHCLPIPRLHTMPHSLSPILVLTFLIGLSLRGAPFHFKLRGGGGGRTVEDYIASYCAVGTPNIGSRMFIKDMKNLSLRIILFTIGIVAGSSYLHQESHPQMYYRVKCLQPIVFYWCTTLLFNMKSQLTNCSKGRNKPFLLLQNYLLIPL